MRERPGPLTLGAFVLVALFGGSNIVAVRLSNRELDPFWGAGSRFAVAAALLVVIALVARIGFPRGRALVGAVVFGLFNFFAFFSFAYFALQPGGVPSALGGVIFGLIPLLTLLLAVAQRIERFRVRALVGAVIAAAGVAALIRAPANADVPIIYVGSMLAAAACAAEASIIVKRFPLTHAVAMNAVGMVVGAPLLLAVSALKGEAWVLPERTTTWVTLAYVIPVGSIALFVLYLYVLHHWTATAASYEFVFFPIVAAIVAAVVADEPLTAAIAVGAILVIAGVYVGALSSDGSTDGSPPAPTPIEVSMPVSDGLSLRRYTTIDDFEEHARAFLLEREAEHNLFLGVCSQIRSGRYTDFYLSTVERHGVIVGASFRTPPLNLVFSHVGERDVIEAIAADAHEVFGSLPGVLGASDDARAFAETWQDRTGQKPTIAMRQRIYQASDVRAPVGVPGELRPATHTERDLIVSWLRAFNDEALTRDAPERVADAERLADYRLSTPDAPLALWWTDRPVSMAGASGPTPNGIRVNAVYTPPELRRRGYASACVAALTQKLLDEGRRFCFLYTDLANPTSNSIYQKIGYRPVADVDQYRFT